MNTLSNIDQNMKHLLGLLTNFCTKAINYFFASLNRYNLGERPQGLYLAFKYICKFTNEEEVVPKIIKNTIKTMSHTSMSAVSTSAFSPHSSRSPRKALYSKTRSTGRSKSSFMGREGASFSHFCKI